MPAKDIIEKIKQTKREIKKQKTKMEQPYFFMEDCDIQYPVRCFHKEDLIILIIRDPLRTIGPCDDCEFYDDNANNCRHGVVSFSVLQKLKHRLPP